MRVGLVKELVLPTRFQIVFAVSSSVTRPRWSHLSISHSFQSFTNLGRLEGGEKGRAVTRTNAVPVPPALPQRLVHWLLTVWLPANGCYLLVTLGHSQPPFHELDWWYALGSNPNSGKGKGMRRVTAVAKEKTKTAFAVTLIPLHVQLPLVICPFRAARGRQSTLDRWLIGKLPWEREMECWQTVNFSILFLLVLQHSIFLSLLVFSLIISLLNRS